MRQHKWAYIKTLPYEQLTTFSFAKNRVHSRLKIINSHEIRVDGNLYDIARISDDGINITYYCLHDSKEESLIAKTRHFNSTLHSPPAKDKSRVIMENIIKTGVITSLNNSIKFLPSYAFNYSYSSFYPEPDITILSPPPQV